MDRLHQGHLMRPSTGHEAALRSVQKPPSKPWSARARARAHAARVEPRDLVQRLTGAPATRKQQQRVTVAQPVPVRATGSGEDATRQMYASASAPWCSFPLMSPAPMHPGLDGVHRCC